MASSMFFSMMMLAGLGQAAIFKRQQEGVPPDFPSFNGTGPTMLRFSCHQLVIDRIDPLVNPGAIPSPHQHQIVGGDAFNASMPLEDIAELSSCTTCSYSEDFSNYWTSNLVPDFRCTYPSTNALTAISSIVLPSPQRVV